LYFIEALQTPSNEQIDEQIVWFSTAINLRPFVAQVQSESGFVAKLKHLAQEVKEADQLLSPSPTPATTVESLEMIGTFFDYISGVIKNRDMKQNSSASLGLKTSASSKMSDYDNFPFWWILFKEFYLSVLFYIFCLTISFRHFIQKSFKNWVYYTIMMVIFFC
jgi:hypothetical protein